MTSVPKSLDHVEVLWAFPWKLVSTVESAVVVYAAAVSLLGFSRDRVTSDVPTSWVSEGDRNEHLSHGKLSLGLAIHTVGREAAAVSLLNFSCDKVTSDVPTSY